MTRSLKLSAEGHIWLPCVFDLAYRGFKNILNILLTVEMGRFHRKMWLPASSLEAAVIKHLSSLNWTDHPLVPQSLPSHFLTFLPWSLESLGLR